MNGCSPPIRAGNSMKMNKEEKKWRAEDDARTLARAQEIASDAKRMRAAETQAKQMASKVIQEAKNLQAVARRPKGKKK